MLERVDVSPRRFDAFVDTIDPDLYWEVRTLAEALLDRRVLMVSSTARGGGVAELLHRTVPLLQDLGVAVEWRVLPASDEFFHVTKKIHNGFQGESVTLSPQEWALYEALNRDVAMEIDPDAWDLILVHDPQPAATLRFARKRGQALWVWRCHVDTSSPDPAVKRPFQAFLAPYDATVFTLPHYILEGVGPVQRTILPGIDSRAEKNAPMEAEQAQDIVARFGIDPARPLVTQVARFDPWKNPLGVLEAFRQARRSRPDLQLALVGESAADDPQAGPILDQVHRAARDVPDVHIIADRAKDVDVNAFQTASSVVLQLSTREGFGLTVSEALWAGTPVVGAMVGGIPEQVEHGRTGFLVHGSDEAARHVRELLADPIRSRRMGRAGHETVRRRFLLPRMIRDELEFWRDLLEGPAGALGTNGATAHVAAPTLHVRSRATSHPVQP